MPPPAQDTTVIALIGEDNSGALNVLAVRHGTQPPYVWTLPCGEADASEWYLDNAERILDEQADLVPVEISSIGRYDTHDSGTFWAFLAFITWAYTDRSDGLPSRDHMGCYWIREDTLSPDFPGLPLDQYTIATDALALKAAAR